MLKPLSNHAQRESLNLGHGFSAVSAVAEHAGQGRHLGEPAAILFAVKLNGEGHKITLHPGRPPTKRVKPAAFSTGGHHCGTERGGLHESPWTRDFNATAKGWPGSRGRPEQAAQGWIGRTRETGQPFAVVHHARAATPN